LRRIQRFNLDPDQLRWDHKDQEVLRRLSGAVVAERPYPGAIRDVVRDVA